MLRCAKKCVLLFAGAQSAVSTSQQIARTIATTVAVDARALGLVLVLISSLVLILSTGAAWLRVP
jgi:hypothetical protein